MTCLRHRFSGFVWQPEARPLRILETNKPEKPLQPSEQPQRNSAPTWLNESFTRGEKSFHQLCPKLRIKAVLCSRTAGHPARPSHRTGMSPAPRRRGRSGTWLPAAACPAPGLSEVRRPRRCAAPCAPGASSGAGTRRSAANHTAAGGGEGCGQAPGTGRSDALLGAQKAPRTPSSQLPP